MAPCFVRNKKQLLDQETDRYDLRDILFVHLTPARRVGGGTGTRVQCRALGTGLQILHDVDLGDMDLLLAALQPLVP